MEIPEDYDGVKTLLQNYRRRINSIFDTLALQAAKLPENKGDSKHENITAISKSLTPRVVQRLDDVVSVLHSFSSATEQASPATSRNDLEAIVQERVQKALLSHGVGSTDAESRRKPEYSASASKKKNKGRNPSYESSKDKNGNASERANKGKPVSKGCCWDRGSRDHFQNSKDCTFNAGETNVDKMHPLSKKYFEKKKSSDVFFSQRLHALE